MTIAQGINKLTVYKAQSALGVPATGAGGKVLRRKTSVASKKRATYENDEIVQHQQSTGVNLGTSSSDWNFDGLLSPGTYSDFMASMLRKAFVATAAITGISMTIAGTAAAWTLTRGAGDYLAGGVKIGDVVRITAGTYANAVNRDNNILVTGVTALVLTGVTLNGSLLIAEGPIATSTVTVVGKKTIAPLTAHTDILFTIEEWYADLSKSELFPDLRIGSVDIGLPASGNATVKLASQGLGVRTNGIAQVLTSPAAATTSPVLTSVRGLLRVGGAATTVVTGVTFSIKTNLTVEGPIVGSDFAPDMARGRIMVSGQITGLFDSTTLRDLFDAETVTSLAIVMAADSANAAEFVCFSMSALKFTGTDPDDGEKAIIRTYPFTAQINANGGASLANDQTILSIQDSLA
ncbi:hypothetical protein UFOVP1254_101 [uncultured Caudovirales phage]|uniref:Uncharacterized protein n=1 Tax=uncultured Caudovirales phage TaxID=2100421 RepID=A0A6J5RLN5_9CAUD|nr:hypothetical protein UFOVP1254_101 [uncultured Caudovirales phage]